MSYQTSDFVGNTHQGMIIITRGENKFRFEMVPSEVDRATYIVGLALSMINLDNIPDHITNTPFVVRFFPQRVMALERTDRKDTMPFRANEGDDLIKVIHMACGMCLNEQTHGKAIPRGPANIDCMAENESV